MARKPTPISAAPVIEAANTAGHKLAADPTPEREVSGGRLKVFPSLPREGFASVNAVRGAFGGCGTSTLYDWVKKGLFPPPVRISPGRVGWPVDVIRAEIASRCAGVPLAGER